MPGEVGGLVVPNLHAPSVPQLQVVTGLFNGLGKGTQLNLMVGPTLQCTEAEMLLYPSEAPPMEPIRAWNDIVKKNREHYDCDPNKLFVDYVNTRFGPYKIW